MSIEELKLLINQNKLKFSTLIFKWQDVDFLPHQYLNAIIEMSGKTPNYIESINECFNDVDSFYDDEPSSMNILNILICDKLDTSSINKCDNVIVICKEVSDKSICGDYLVEFPKLESWQIGSYISTVCNGLDSKNVEWLQKIAKDNIYRIDNEISKISIFPKEMQNGVFEQMVKEHCYSDLSENCIYDLINSLIKKDYNKVRDVLVDINNIDVEGTGLVTLLYRNIKNIINIQMNPKASPTTLNMNPKQFNAIKYNCGKLTNLQLVKVFDFLSFIDYRLKSGLLPLTNDEMISYIVCNFIGV